METAIETQLIGPEQRQRPEDILIRDNVSVVTTSSSPTAEKIVKKWKSSAVCCHFKKKNLKTVFYFVKEEINLHIRIL